MKTARSKIGVLKLGNSRAVFWRLDKKLPQVFENKHFHQKQMKSLLRGLDLLVVESVVPKTNQSLKALSGPKLKFVSTKDIKIKMAYTKGLGIDRALNIQAAAELFDLQRKNFVVVDAGSAVTVDFVERGLKHKGGWICVGPRLSAEALSEKTGQLPLVKLKKPVEVGRTTRQCLEAGQSQMLEAYIDRALTVGKSLFGSTPRLVLTGGWSPCITKRGEHRKEHLSLYALRKIALDQLN